MDENQGKVKSLQKALDILDELTRAKNSMTLSEIAKRCGFPKSTTHALVSTMRDRGLLRQLPNGSYAPGIRLFEYGCAVSRGFDINNIARPYLESLSAVTGASSVITMLDGSHAVSVDYAASPSGVQILPEIGVRLPLHCTSQGKLMLAYQPPGRIKSYIAQEGLRQFTPHTITEPERLSAVLSDIRSRGYSVEDGEYKVGLRSVSAPVFDSAGELKYALSTIGFFRRVQSDELRKVIDATVKQAKMLSASLGYDSLSAHI